MNKTLIIGGCGYIGSRLFQFLSEKKYEVDTLDIEWFGNYINKANIKKNYRDVDKSFLDQYENVVLLAGYSSVQMCEGNMIGSFENNVENFVKLLNKLTKQKFIYASSSGVYGNTKNKLVDEGYDRYSPTNYYDLTKKEIDYYAELSRIRHFGLRLGTVNGFSSNLRIDLMINKMYENARKNQNISIYNPNIFRPILGIEDLCRAIEAILENDGSSGLYNLASFNLTIQDIAEKVSNSMGSLKIINKGNTPSYNFSISTKKFEKMFNFRFKDTVESLVNSLAKGYNKTHKSTRDSLYEKNKKM